MSDKILVIDDEAEVRDILKLTLQRAGYRVITAANGFEGLARARDARPDLILLDIMLPDMDGRQVCRRLRETTDVPIMMLTVLRREDQIVQGLYLGADDYLAKPWSSRELLARIRALLRRANTTPPRKSPDLPPCEALIVDPMQRIVAFQDKKITLTSIELRLLIYLARRLGQVVPYAELIDQVWGNKFEGDLDTLRVHVHNLRQKLEKDPQNPQYLLTKKSLGYSLVECAIHPSSPAQTRPSPSST